MERLRGLLAYANCSLLAMCTIRVQYLEQQMVQRMCACYVKSLTMTILTIVGFISRIVLEVNRTIGVAHFLTDNHVHPLKHGFYMLRRL